MRKFRRVISTVLLTVMLLGTLPIVPISAATVSNPFDSTVVSGSTCTLTRYNSSYTASTISTKVLNSVSVSSATTFGSNEEVTLYDTTIKSTGNRKMAARSTMGKTYNLWAESFNAHIAIGGEGARLFTYSMPCSKDFQNGYVEEIAKAFEADHPEWSVAVVTNGSFFKYTAPDSNKGIPASNITSEPEDVYIEDGKTYDTYIEKGNFDNCKVGRGVIGIKSDGTPIHYTLENGTSRYAAASTPYTWDVNYTLEVLGSNLNNSIYDYAMRLGTVFDYTELPLFFPQSTSGSFASSYVYKIKCSEYKKAYIGVNGKNVSANLEGLAPTYFFEGQVTSVTKATSVSSASGYVYVVSPVALDNIAVGTTLRGQKKMSATAWKDVDYAFGFKQHILLNGEPLFDNAFQEAYGETKYGSWNAWTEDVHYATYSSNRTAVGFKANGDPVLVSIPRTQYYTEYSKRVEIGPSYHEVAWYMKSLGCVNAFMMDCGGSVHMSAKNPTTGVYYDVVNNPGLTAGTTIAERMIYNALIIAYPSGKAANEKDTPLSDPSFAPEYITATTKNTWNYGLTWQGGDTKPLNAGTKTTSGAISTSNFSLSQGTATYTITPITLSNNYTAMYLYKSLGYKVEAGKKYTYCFKMATQNDGKYAAVLFGKKPDFETDYGKLNDFATIGGTFSNNLGDYTYADVRVGYGRLVKDDATEQGYASGRSIQLSQEVVGGKSYGYCRVDIDGLNYTVKVKNYSGAWVEIKPKSGAAYYTLPSGTELILGGTAWEGSFNMRIMSIKDPICVDLTSLSNNITAANALKSAEYTADSWSVLTSALSEANTAKTSVSQPYIDYANEKLAAAIAGLVKRIDIANANIAEYEGKDAAAYTTESWAPYTDAYEDLVAAVAANNLTALDALNSAYDEAKANLVAASVSLDVAWQTMSFTYETDSARWDPQTHTYVDEGDGSSSGWVANGNSNVIELTNNSNVALDVGFEFSRDDSVDGISGISGAFYSNDSAVTTVALDKGGAAQSVSFMLEGAPTASLDNAKCGTVTLTVTRRKE